jgi:hypothetical protein
MRESLCQGLERKLPKIVCMCVYVCVSGAREKVTNKCVCVYVLHKYISVMYTYCVCVCVCVCVCDINISVYMYT